jgi:hypothetical protein
MNDVRTVVPGQAVNYHNQIKLDEALARSHGLMAKGNARLRTALGSAISTLRLQAKGVAGSAKAALIADIGTLAKLPEDPK